MVIPLLPFPRRRRGALITEMVVALAIAAIALIPLAYSFHQEHRLLLAYYRQAVAMEIIDGEMEILVAGQWHAFKPGTQSYAVQAAAARSLPKGQFTLTLEDRLIRLEWTPEKRGKEARVAREVRLP